MKKLYAIALVLAILGLAGCGHRNGEEGERYAADLPGIEVIQMDHGSTTLHLESADIDSLEASLLRYDNGPGITLNKGKDSLSIGLQSSFFRIRRLQAIFPSKSAAKPFRAAMTRAPA